VFVAVVVVGMADVGAAGIVVAAADIGFAVAVADIVVDVDMAKLVLLASRLN
jgi:hypothetical protein